MKDVSRKEYVEFLKAHKELIDRPTEGYNISVMQHLNADKKVLAQAIYNKGLAPRYQIES